MMNKNRVMMLNNGNFTMKGAVSLRCQFGISKGKRGIEVQ